MNTTLFQTEPASPARPSNQPLTHFAVYEDLNLICNRVFDKGRMTIGSSQKADLCLDHAAVASIHAEVYYHDRQVFLTNKFPQNGLQLNGRSVGLVELQHDDVIDIGPFSLKVEFTEAEPMESTEPDAVYAVRLVNRYPTPERRRAAADHLAAVLSATWEQVLPFLEKDHHVIKRNLSAIKAAHLQNELLKAGVICDVQIADDRASAEVASPPLPEDPAATAHETTDTVAAQPAPMPIVEVAFSEIFEDEVDEGEEIWEAPFSLKHELNAPAPPQDAGRQQHLQVIKTIDDTVIDVHDLGRREKYVIDSGHGRMRLVDANRKGERFISLLPAFSGYLQAPSGDVTADLNGYRKPEYLKNKKKRLYRVPLPEDYTVVVETPGGRYQIASVHRHPTPNVAAAARPSDVSWRHWASSAGIHLLLLVCLSVAMVLQVATPPPPEPRFADIDPSILEKLKPLKAPVKPEPPKIAKKPEPPKAKPIKPEPPPKKVVTKRAPKKNIARPKPVSRHAKAGGGHGKGNIKNRNIKQAGLLSMLQSPSAGGTSNALVAVTNLDAVPVPGASEKAFSVGGLKGSLGNGKIAVATQGAIIQTKGSQQVLRSAGARGDGDVAALERGTTGTKKVQAMVSAKMNRKVKIKGGMSRDVVKRVIDQHLEEITYCYETALMTDSSILGRIVFEWKILMDGRVGEVRIVNSSVSSHELHSCIKSAIKAWQFPKPVGAEVVVSYPFVFDLVSF